MNPDRVLDQPEAPLRKLRKANMTEGRTTWGAGCSSSDAGTPNEELNTFEKSKEEDWKQEIDGRIKEINKELKEILSMENPGSFLKSEGMYTTTC